MFKIALTILLANSLYSSEMIEELVKKRDIAQKEFLQKQVAIQVSKMSPEAQSEYKEYEKLNTKTKSRVVIYFTSQSLEGSHQISLTNEVVRLNKQGANIKVVSITRGFDDGVIKYAKKLNDQILTMAPLQLQNFKDATVPLRINPKMFKKFNIIKVPAIVTAECVGTRPSEKICTFFYKASGKTSISKMLEIGSLSIDDLFKKAAR